MSDSMKYLFVLLTVVMTVSRAGASNIAVPTLSTEQLLRENASLRKVLTEAPVDPGQFRGKRLAVLTTDGVEAIELEAARDYFQKRGAEVEIVAPRMPEFPAKFGVHYPPIRKTKILTVRFMENAEWIRIDRFLDEAQAESYDAVIIAGGAWNPDSLRTEPKALAFLKKANASGKTIAAICHAPLVLLNAGLLKGRAATAVWNVQEDLKNAGAKLQDVPVVIDGNLITSRHPTDLPDFLMAIGAALLK